MRVLVFLMSYLLVTSSWGVTIKVGVLAPAGSSWAKQLKAMSKEIKKATDGKVKFKMYLGGSLGDESDVLRKIRVGQVHGGLFTGKTLGDINGDVRIMEVPFTFNHDQQLADRALDTLESIFTEQFNKKGFVNLGFFKIGFVYFASKKKVTGLSDLSQLKIWSWEGDPIVENMIAQMHLNAVPLPLPDVLSSLTTGIIDAAYASPLGIVALQWNSKVKYIVNFPIAYSIGAFLVYQKRWAKVKPADQVLIRKITKKYIDLMNKQTLAENDEALQVMQSNGIELIDFGKQDIAQGNIIRNKIIHDLTGKVFSAAIVKKFNGVVKK